MFLREVKRENRNGTQVSYLQLVHNDWDPAARTSRTKILYSFGRTDQVDTAAIERLIVSLSRLLDPAAALRATAGSDLSFICSRPLGGTDVLDGLWRRLGIDTVMTRLLAHAAGQLPVRAGAVRAGRQPGTRPVLEAGRRGLDHPRRAHRRAARDQRRRLLPGDGLAPRRRATTWNARCSRQVANLLNLEVDLLFFDYPANRRSAFALAG